MSKVSPIIELHPWLALPSGQALLDWEQAQVDRLVADVFGFHALQLGLPELDGLRCNRMPHKWLALVAVQGSVPYWQRQGFAVVNPLSASAISALASYHGEQACYMQLTQITQEA